MEMKLYNQVVSIFRRSIRVFSKPKGSKTFMKVNRQNLSTECHRFDYSIITVACCDTKADDIAKIMTADNIRFPLIVTGELNRAFLRFRT